MKLPLQPSLNLRSLHCRALPMLAIVVGVLWLFTAAATAQTATPTRTPAPTRTLTRTPVLIEIYLPVVNNGAGRTSVTGQPIEALNGVVGQIHRATGRTFGNYLLTNDGLTYGLVGGTVAVEEQITALRNTEPPTAVVVWGTSYRIVGEDDVLVIVVNQIQSATAPPEATPSALPVAKVKFDLVNLRIGPATSYANAGQVVRDQRCTVVGRNRNTTWLELQCSETVRGWIDWRLVDVTGDATTLPITEPTIIVVITPTPTVTPTPTRLPLTATPVPPPAGAWRASYFDNRNLQGTPAAVQDAATINFTWGANPPVAGLPADGFAARFERQVNFNDGYHRFSIDVDDGVRFWLDDELLIDEWHGAENRTYTVGRYLRGVHTLRIDYYEANGLASLHFLSEYITAFPEWEATYFDGVTLTGPAVFSQLEARAINPLDYEWRNGSPLPSRLGRDTWSARWVGQFRFTAATYIFRTIADDGVRVYLNDQLVIDGWRDGYIDLTNRFYAVGAGIHTVRVEYYERTGNAQLRVWWFEDFANSPR